MVSIDRMLEYLHCRAEPCRDVERDGEHTMVRMELSKTDEGWLIDMVLRSPEGEMHVTIDGDAEIIDGRVSYDHPYMEEFIQNAPYYLRRLNDAL